MLREVEAEITKLERVADVLRSIELKGEPQSTRSGMSAAARKKISLAQKARWAKNTAAEKPVDISKPTRTISAAGRKRIAAAQRARWAKIRSQKKAA
jgi:hypothetical protein